MKKIPLWKMFVLPFITLGIWGLIWINKTGKAAQEKTGIQVPSIWVILWPILLFIPAVALAVLAVIDGASAAENLATDAEKAAAFETAFEDSSFAKAFALFPIVALAALIGQVYFYIKWSKAVSKALNDNPGNAAIALLMILVEWPIGMPYVQSQINKLVEQE